MELVLEVGDAVVRTDELVIELGDLGEEILDLIAKRVDDHGLCIWIGMVRLQLGVLTICAAGRNGRLLVEEVGLCVELVHLAVDGGFMCVRHSACLVVCGGAVRQDSPMYCQL